MSQIPWIMPFLVAFAKLFGAGSWKTLQAIGRQTVRDRVMQGSGKRDLFHYLVSNPSPRFNALYSIVIYSQTSKHPNSPCPSSQLTVCSLSSLDLIQLPLRSATSCISSLVILSAWRDYARKSRMSILVQQIRFWTLQSRRRCLI